MQVGVAVNGYAIDATGGQYKGEAGFHGYAHTYSTSWTQLTQVVMFKVAAGVHTIGAIVSSETEGKRASYNGYHMLIELKPRGFDLVGAPTLESEVAAV